MRQHLLIVVFWILVSPVSSFAQAGSIDKTFNASDPGFGNGDGTMGKIYSTLVEPAGKIIIAGEFGTFNGVTRNNIARLLPNGKIDSTFNPGSGTSGISGGAIYDALLQPDGKLVIAGEFNQYNNHTTGRITRLHSNGSIDNSFNSSIGANDRIFAVALQGDGKILAGGTFTQFNGATRSGLVRLNADGSTDTSFSIGTGISHSNGNANIRCIQLLADGKILIGGYFEFYNNTSAAYVARINNDGTLDTSFNSTIGADDEINALALQDGGKIIIAGNFSMYNSTPVARIARLLPNGSLDTSFASSGADYYINSLSVDGSGKILVAGNFSLFNGTVRRGLVRLFPNGSLDSMFNPHTNEYNYQLFSAIEYSTGNILISGQISNTVSSRGLAMVHDNGMYSTTFNVATAANGKIMTVAVQADDRIVIGGSFTAYDNEARGHIARILPDGALDTSFNPAEGFDDPFGNYYVQAIAVQPDGRMLVAGNFHTYNNVSRNYLCRLNSNGTLDTSFNIGTGPDDVVNTVAVQQDGKVIIGGNFSTYNGSFAPSIARLNSNGSIDNSFNIGAGANSSVRTIMLQPDGKILVAGNFTSFNSTAAERIVRLSQDGSNDNTFNSAPAANDVISCLLSSDSGRVIVAGLFSMYASQPVNKLTQISASGALIPGFNPGSSVSNGSNIAYILTLLKQQGGKILLAGSFSSYNGTAANGLVRINSNGAMDTSFNTGTGIQNSSYGSPTIHTSALQSDGKVIIAGDFTSFNNIGANRIVRLNTNSVPTYTFIGSGDWSNPGNWLDNKIPPTPVPSGAIIMITPIAGGTCSFNGNLALPASAKLEIRNGVNLQVNGSVLVQ